MTSGEKLPFCPLTPAERDVVRLTAMGCTGEQAALRRGTAPPTVESQIQKALRKTGAINRAHLVAICLRRGWIK